MIRQLLEINNGRIYPSNMSLDADLVELSSADGNDIQRHEDGLYYKQPTIQYTDGLSEKGQGILGIEEYGIPLNKIEKVVSSPKTTPIDPSVLQSLEEHLSNLYGYVQTLKSDIISSELEFDSFLSGLDSRIDSRTDTSINIYDSTATAKFVLKSDPTLTLKDSTGVLSRVPIFYVGTTVANSEGDWSIDYTSAGFSVIPTVVATGQSVGTAAADRRFVSINPNNPTRTSCSGKLVSASSAGLLAAMTMINASGNLSIIAIGY